MPESDNLLSTFFVLNGEKIPDNGEDSYCYAHTPTRSLIAVFDGCGGSGARVYPKLNNKTSAYIASRLAAGESLDWFMRRSNREFENDGVIDSLADQIGIRFDSVKQNHLIDERSAITGSMTRSLPTTAAMALIETRSSKSISLSYMSAGDSRGYILAPSGLIQCTCDDLTVELDALENISRDAPLSNCINADTAFQLNTRRIDWQMPCIVFVATDGMFGYFRTPMEFEYCLLDTMSRSDCVETWSQMLEGVISSITADDYSLVLCAYDFSSFEKMKRKYQQRLRILNETYIVPLYAANPDDSVIKGRLWAQYRTYYESVIKG